MQHVIYRKDLYINSDIDSVIYGNIREYDIKAAGFNILKSKNMLTNSEIQYLESLNKKNRSIQLGLILKRKPELKPELKDGFKEYRLKFFESNELDDNDVMAIRKDSIMTLNRKCEILKFDSVEFVLKNKYRSYCKLNNTHIYFKPNGAADIKGIGDDEKELNIKYKKILSFISEIFSLCSIDKNKARIKLRKFANDYVNLKLDKEYYREFKSEGEYKLMIHVLGKDYFMKDCKSLKNVDINYNYRNIVLPLIALIF